ncbi:STAS domain-containing protein [Longispora urticae]
MEFECHTRRPRADLARLVLSGDLDAEVTGLVYELAVDAARGPEVRGVEVDLRDVPVADAAAVALLRAARRVARTHQVDLWVSRPSDAVLAALRDTRSLELLGERTGTAGRRRPVLSLASL